MGHCNVCEVDDEIEVCVLHAAALQLLEALKTAKQYVDATTSVKPSKINQLNKLEVDTAITLATRKPKEV